MTFLQFFRLLRARWLLLAGGAAIGLTLAFLWVLFTERSYQATAQVLVDVRAPETLGSQGSTMDQLAPDYLSTQTDILRSDTVRLKVVQQLGLAKTAQAQEDYKQSGTSVPIQNFIADRLAKGLQLVPASSSRVISINYSSPDPHFAAAVANAIAEAYRDISVSLLVEPARQSADWYQTRANEVQRDLQVAQEKLSARQQQLGVSADADQTDADVARLTGLSSQLAQAQAERAASGARAGGGSLPDAMASPVVQGIQTELAKLEAQRQQLAKVAGPNNIDMIQLNGQIAALRQQMAEQRALIAKSASASAAQSASSVSALSKAVAEQRARVIEGRSNRSELALLQGDVDNLKRTYDQIVSRRAQLGIMGEGIQTNVAILSAATTPDRPAWPRPFLMLAIGIVFGSIIGGAAAVLTELSDQRLRSADDHETWLGIPNLGTIYLGAPQQSQIGATIRRYLPRPGAV